MKSASLMPVCFALIAGPAFAQTPASPAAPVAAPSAPVVAATPAPPVGNCGPAPTAPVMGDVTGLTAKQITAATESLNAFLLNAQGNLACRRAAIEMDRAAWVAKQEVLKAQTDAYNEDIKAITGVRDAWDAQVKAYNDKQSRRR